MRNYLIFAGRDSRDFGVYISGQGTFSAPSRAYSFNPIAGRNGALIGNERRLENIEVSYECFICADFDKNIGNFRSFLLSCIGYQELSDSYHPDEFRLACYTGPFIPEVRKQNDAGSFTLTFNCKPQRYLTSGKTSYSWYANSGQTVTGASILVTNTAALDPTILTSHYLVRPTGDNILKVTINSVALYENDVEVRRKNFSTNYPIGEATVDWIAGTAQKISDSVILRAVTQSSWQRESAKSFSHEEGYSRSFSGIDWFTKGAHYDDFFDGDPTFNTVTQRFVFTTRASYSTLSEFFTALQATFGVGYEADKIICRLNAHLSTPESVSFTPYEIPVSGQVKYAAPQYGAVADNTVTVQYLSSDGMANPTPFPSSPLIRVTGNGSFEMDGVTVTVTNSTEYCDIDCELMDCYEGSTNRNADVTFSTYDFPKLQPGENAITINAGITHIEIWPRWWMV